MNGLDSNSIDTLKNKRNLLVTLVERVCVIKAHLCPIIIIFITTIILLPQERQRLDWAVEGLIEIALSTANPANAGPLHRAHNLLRAVEVKPLDQMVGRGQAQLQLHHH